MDLWRLLQVLVRRRWVPVVSALLTLAAAVALYYLMGSDYRAGVLLLPSEAALQGSTSLSPGVAAPELAAGTRAARMESLIILARDTALAVRVSAALVPEGIALSPERLLERVAVRPVSGETGGATAILRVEVRGQRPDEVRAIADRWASEFIRNYRRLATVGADRTITFLRGQRDDARAELEGVEAAIVRFRRARGIGATDEERGRAAGDWASRRGDWQAALASLGEAKAELAWVSARLARTPETVTRREETEKETLAQRLEQQIQQEELRLTTELATKTEEHWDVQPIRRRLEALRHRLEPERGRLRVTRTLLPNPGYRRLDEQRSVLEERVAALTARVARQRQAMDAESARLTRYADTDIELARQARARQLAEGRYLTFASRVNDAVLQRRLLADRDYLVRSPERDGIVVEGPTPRAPRLPQLCLMALAVGLALGVGAILLLDLLDTSVRTSRDAESLVGLPVAGIVPRADAAILPAMLPQVTHLQPTSAQAEAYRFLGAEVLLRARDEDLRVLMVATGKPGQGGTATVANLAITLAQAGQRVVLVDADMRRPQLHAVFGCPLEPGLSHVLANGMGPSAALSPTDVPNLLLLPAGASPENPWQLLKSRKMFEVIASLRDGADFVLLDTPSALVFADALALIGYVDGVLIVLRAGQAASGRELQVKSVLNRAGAPILGVVLNDVEGGEVDSYRYHHRYYRGGEGATEHRIAVSRGAEEGEAI